MQTFDQIMEEIGIEQYLKANANGWHLGRTRYNRVNMLKTVLFGSMDNGYASLRDLEKQCKINIRYMYLMDYAQPSFRAFSCFINEEIEGSIEEAFKYAYRQPVKGNLYGRQEEIYQCEDCSGCPYAEQCKRLIRTEQFD